jgi:hypothetical protein
LLAPHASVSRMHSRQTSPCQQGSGAARTEAHARRLGDDGGSSGLGSGGGDSELGSGVSGDGEDVDGSGVDSGVSRGGVSAHSLHGGGVTCSGARAGRAATARRWMVIAAPRRQRARVCEMNGFMGPANKMHKQLPAHGKTVHTLRERVNAMCKDAFAVRVSWYVDESEEKDGE